MAKNKELKFKKNESFYIRDGWIEKAINSINDSDVNVFAKNNGVSILGIGTNMVKGLKYWLQAANIITLSSTKTELSDFGKVLLKYDPYLESNFSWFFVHYFLATNEYDCPVFFAMFNSTLKTFNKSDAVQNVSDYFLADMGIAPKKEYIDDDFSVFVKSYYNDEIVDCPEDNYVCPLSGLKLISKSKDKYIKTKPTYNSLNYLIVYYALLSKYGVCSFNIEDSIATEKSPCKLFNLDKNTLFQYLEEMKKYGLVTINKTAGLNIVYIDKQLTLDEIFNLYYGG